MYKSECNPMPTRDAAIAILVASVFVGAMITGVALFAGHFDKKDRGL